jgi:cysteine desulfurase/selenocysteine lyase
LLDVDKIRMEYPILQSGVIYMDSAASSLTPEPVLDKMTEFYHQYRANIDRGIHRLSQRASEEYVLAHEKVARFLNARSDEEVVITRNTTEGLNMVANGLKWNKGDKIVATVMDHHSNFIIWQRVKQRHGAKLEIVRPNEQGLFNLTDFDRAIDDSTRLVAVPHVSNAVGSIAPIRDIVKIAASKGALTVIDAAQSVPHMKVDVREVDCDFLAFSGHKMCGPTGSGGLYIKGEMAEQIEPSYIGGGTIQDVSLGEYQLTSGWRRFEAGTPAIAEGIGLGRAVDYMTQLGMENVRAHEMELGRKLYEGLKEIGKVKVYGPEDPKDRVALTSFNVGDLNPHDVALALDVSKKIMIRSGHHCALPTMKEIIHADGTARASLYVYNSAEEVEVLLSTMEEIACSLG